MNGCLAGRDNWGCRDTNRSLREGHAFGEEDTWSGGPVARRRNGRNIDFLLGCCGRGLRGRPVGRRALLRAGGDTIDLDGTDVEVYGAAKDGIAYSYKGARAGRPHVATWAEAGVVTAADLLAGDEDPRPGAGSLIERSVATLR